jgi:hypothetical protein
VLPSIVNLKLESTELMTATLAPGDILMIPPMWLHFLYVGDAPTASFSFFTGQILTYFDDNDHPHNLTERPTAVYPSDHRSNGPAALLCTPESLTLPCHMPTPRDVQMCWKRSSEV